MLLISWSPMVSMKSIPDASVTSLKRIGGSGAPPREGATVSATTRAKEKIEDRRSKSETRRIRALLRSFLFRTGVPLHRYFPPGRRLIRPRTGRRLVVVLGAEVDPFANQFQLRVGKHRSRMGGDHGSLERRGRILGRERPSVEHPQHRTASRIAWMDP